MVKRTKIVSSYVRPKGIPKLFRKVKKKKSSDTSFTKGGFFFLFICFPFPLSISISFTLFSDAIVIDFMFCTVCILFILIYFYFSFFFLGKNFIKSKSMRKLEKRTVETFFFLRFFFPSRERKDRKTISYSCYNEENVLQQLNRNWVR